MAGRWAAGISFAMPGRANNKAYGTAETRSVVSRGCVNKCTRQLLELLEGVGEQFLSLSGGNGSIWS